MSLSPHVQEQPAPAVGMGASWNGYSDRYAGTIVAVSKSGRTITVQEDAAELLNGAKSGEPDALTFHPGGFFGHTAGRQRYSYTRNPKGQTVKFTLRSNGRFVMVKTRAHNGARLTIGTRNKHHDFNF